jgi:hypothetical protein
MGYTQTLTVPASGGGEVPINVCGQTLISCPTGDLQVAYDPADYASSQYTVLSGAAAPQVLYFSKRGNTVLWIRQDPTLGAPAAELSVWTDIDGENV